MAEEPAPEAVQPEHKAFQLKEPPPLNFKVPFDHTAQRALILAAMSAPPEQWSLCVSPLENYTKAELSHQWQVLLKEGPPPELKFPPAELATCTAFEKDEDLVLLLFIRSQPSITFQQLITQFGFVFKPFRSFASILKRIEELKAKSASEIDQFYDDYAHDVVDEELFSMFSQEGKADIDPKAFAQSICTFNPDPPISTLESIAFANESLKTTLAIIRSEERQYFM
jgi:hypothetical protein